MVEQAMAGNAVTYDRRAETSVAKAIWFQSLTLSERMDLLCEFTDLILGANPDIVKTKDVEPIKGRVLVLSET